MAEKECIEREAALTAISTITMYKGGISFETAKYRLETIPAADVKRVIRSKWKYIEYYPEGHDYKCQKCRFKNAEPTNYCPSCGAVMMGMEP